MIEFWRSRRVGLVIVAAVAVEFSMLAWAWRAFKVPHEGLLIAVPLAVPAQMLTVAIALYSTSSAFRALEASAHRSLVMPRLMTLGIQAGAILAPTAFVCVVIGDSGTLGVYAPLKALLGAWGLGLIGSFVIDRRLAGLIGLVPLVAPLVLNPHGRPFASVWAFATAKDADSTAWLTAGALFAIGAVLHVGWERLPRAQMT